MKISIYSIKETLYEGEAEKLICHTPQGQITVLDHHIPLISRLTGPDLTVVQKNGERRDLQLVSGFLEVRPGSDAVILAD